MAALFALTGCGTGFGAQTNQQYDGGVGNNARGPHVQVHNALFVDNGDSTATFSAALLNLDDTTHTLTSAEATTSDGTAIALTFAATRELKPNTYVLPGTTGDIILTGKFPAGGFVEITLNFTGAAPVTIDAPVITRTETYESVATKAAPSTTPAEATPTS